MVVVGSDSCSTTSAVSTQLSRPSRRTISAWVGATRSSLASRDEGAGFLGTTVQALSGRSPLWSISVPFGVKYLFACSGRRSRSRQADRQRSSGDSGRSPFLRSRCVGFFGSHLLVVTSRADPSRSSKMDWMRPLPNVCGPAPTSCGTQTGTKGSASQRPRRRRYAFGSSSNCCSETSALRVCMRGRTAMGARGTVGGNGACRIQGGLVTGAHPASRYVPGPFLRP